MMEETESEKQKGDKKMREKKGLWGKMGKANTLEQLPTKRSWHVEWKATAMLESTFPALIPVTTNRNEGWVAFY